MTMLAQSMKIEGLKSTC